MGSHYINQTSISRTPSQHRVTFRFNRDVHVVGFSFFHGSESRNTVIHEGGQLLHGHRSFRLIYPLKAQYLNPRVRFMLILFGKAENEDALIKIGKYLTSYASLCNRTVVHLN